jgi:UDP-glucose 4-epimerase
MRVMVTGGAGFIGSHLIDALLKRGDSVVVVDNLSSGKLSFIQDHINDGKVEHINHDLTNLEGMAQHFEGIEMVFHLAANADIRLGTQITDTDLRHGTVATYNVLESMRLTGVDKIVFASSSVVYGENAPMPTPETYGPTIPISLYGASKLAAEGLIGSWVGTFGFQAWVFRFANIIGERGTHGVIFDFINKLNATPNRLEVLGNGLQEKSYMEVKECVTSILHVVEHTDLPFNLCNLGSVDTISVRQIAETVVEETGYHDALIDYTGGDRGWAGDIPRARLAIDKLNQLGYLPSMNSKEAVRHTVRALIKEIGLR